MKRLMTAAMAVTLMCGVSAFAQAQDTQPATTGDSSAAAPAQGAMAPGPAASPPQGNDQSGPAPQGPMNNGPAPAAGTPDASGGGMAPPPAAGAPDASAGGGMAGNTPDGSHPTSYPPCTSKGQDRCVQSGKMMKGGHKAKARHHAARKAAHKKAMASAPAASAAPATAPAPGA